MDTFTQLFWFFSLLFISCSKSDSSTSTSNSQYHLDATINGSKFSWQSIGTFSFDMNDGCVADFTTDYRNFSDVGTFY